MKIGVVVQGGLVETLQATPLLTSVRADHPEATTTFVCPSAAEQLAPGLPLATETVFLHCLDDQPHFGAIFRLWFWLRQQRFDVIFLCGDSSRLVSAAYGAGIPTRIGLSSRIARWLLTNRIRAERGENRAASWARLSSVLGGTSVRHHLWFDPGERARQRAARRLHGSELGDGRFLVALAPGIGVGTAPPNHEFWEPERYAHLANQLTTRHGAGVVLVGTEEDKPLVTRTSEDLASPHVDLCGSVDIFETAATLAHCDLFIGGDSALHQIAAAVGTPTIGLFGGTNGALRSAYGSEHRVVQALPRQSRGRLPTLDSIRVDDILASIEAAG